ncbi:hypothetical protein [Saccharothrix stipae]
MDTTHQTAMTRLTGVLMTTALTAMVAGAAIVVPSGLTLNPADPAAALAAVRAEPWLHRIELGLDVVGWVALLAAALTLAARSAATGPRLALLPAGLLAGAGLAGVLHDAGNLALTGLAARPGAAEVAVAVLLTAKWMVNLAGLLWVAATAAAVLWVPVWGGVPMSAGMRRAGVLAALSGLVAVVLPWTTGADGLSAAAEQLGYALHLPIMIWYGALAWRDLRPRPGGAVDGGR